MRSRRRERRSRVARILIVDDEESIRATLAAFLAKDGHAVSSARDAAEAADLLTEGTFDVVISDIVLPRKDGVALLADVRAAHPNVQVVLITGKPDVETAAEAVRQGAFDYLAKPVTRDAVCAVAARAAEKKALIDETQRLQEENREYQERLERRVEERTEELRRSAERYGALFGSIPDPVFVFDAETSRFLDCNRAAVERYGYSLDELRTKTPHDLHPHDEHPDVDANIESEDRTPNRYTHVTRTGHRFPVEVHTAELEYEGKLAWISIARDFSRIDAAERRAVRLLQQQRRVNKLALELGNVFDVTEVYEAVYRHVRGLMDATSMIVALYDADARLLRAEFVIFRQQPFDASKLPPIPLEERGRGTQSQVIHTGEPLYIPDYREARRSGRTEYSVDDSGAVREGPPPDGADEITRSALFAPLTLGGKTVGVLQVQSYRLDAYSQDDIDLLGAMANVTAVAVDNARLVQRLRNALNGTVRIASETVEIRDPYTAGHQERVARLACAVGRQLGLPDDQTDGLRVAALLHDVGKMAIPAEILSKPARLTDVEFELIREHPRVAYDLLKGIEFPWPIADVILQHHETLDGSGYPRGLEGSDILLEARILSVCDVVEAMASHRPYRPALGIDAALEEIEAHAGERYDADVVEACLHLFKKDAFSFEENDESPRAEVPGLGDLYA